MKNKKRIIIRTSLAIAVGVLTANAALAWDPRDLIPNNKSKRETPSIPKEVPSAPKQETLQEAQSAGVPADAGCPKSTESDKWSPTEILGRKALRTIIDEATEALKLGPDVEMPSPIENYCQASKRLRYVEKHTGRWSTTVIDSIMQAKAALSLSGEAASYAAFRNNPDFSAVKGKQISQLQDDMRSDLTAIEAAIAEKREANQEMLAVAGTNMRAALMQGTLIGAWDKRLVEFMGDNAKWAIREHLADARLFGSHVELLGGTLTSMQSVIKAQDAASGEPSAAARKKAEAQRKQREKENAEYEKQLLADLKL